MVSSALSSVIRRNVLPTISFCQDVCEESENISEDRASKIRREVTRTTTPKDHKTRIECNAQMVALVDTSRLARCFYTAERVENQLSLSI